MKALEKAAEIILEQKRGFAFTGAGMSTASGIPDFRSPTGVWAKYDAKTYAYIESFLADQVKVWDFFLLREREYSKAEPNPGHTALAELESMNLLDAVVTQNIDSLHSRAGSNAVYEVHGSMESLTCLECFSEYSRTNKKAYIEKNDIPYCSCGAVLKPGVVFFGEGLPQNVFSEAKKISEAAKFVIVAGTSAQVYPAAQLPHRAKRNGAFIIEVNAEKTALTPTADVFLQGATEEVLPNLVKVLKTKL